MAIDRRVDVELHRRHCIALDQPTIQVDQDDVVGCQCAAHRSAGVDQQSIGTDARAEVTVEIDDLGTLQHQDRVGQHLLHLRKVAQLAHVGPSCLQRLDQSVVTFASRITLPQRSASLRK